MRITYLLLPALLLLLPACGKDKPEPAVEEKDPIFIGDDTAPIQIRTYNKAKEVKKQVDEQRKEEKKILQERD